MYPIQLQNEMQHRLQVIGDFADLLAIVKQSCIERGFTVESAEKIAIEYAKAIVGGINVNTTK